VRNGGEVMTATAGAPLENLKPKRGMLVLLAGTDGVWQVLDPAPPVKGERPPGSWWLSPWDETAREAPKHPQLGSYRVGTFREMKPARVAGVRQ